jgi:hypothetical protein
VVAPPRTESKKTTDNNTTLDARERLNAVAPATTPIRRIFAPDDCVHKVCEGAKSVWHATLWVGGQVGHGTKVAAVWLWSP